MKKSLIVLAALAVVTTAFSEEKKPLTEMKDKVSYSIGVDIGNTFKKQNVEVNADVLMQGIKDALAGGKTALTPDEMKATMTAFSQDLMKKQETAMKEAAQKNKGEGEKFLAENKKKPGVKTTASGLQYKVLKEGTGPKPAETDAVVTDYKGTLINGTEFDSSYKRGQPAEFPVDRVIKGWTEGLQLMKAGSKYQFFVPPDLAYGERGAGQEIGPNETLIFEVELKSIKKPTPSPAPAASTSPSVSPSKK
jgi:FKBP-type peptidyl-prolyl cis-trans isomerase FklB